MTTTVITTVVAVIIHMLRQLLLSGSGCGVVAAAAATAKPPTPPPPPRLSGMHFIVTVLDAPGYLQVKRVKKRNNGTTAAVGGTTTTPHFSGYLVDMFKGLARWDRANFTYEFRTPSGFGSHCEPRLLPSSLNLNGGAGSNNNNKSNSNHNHWGDAAMAKIEAYDEIYDSQYNCGTGDVNEDFEGLLGTSNYSSDMYLGMFYISPARQELNYFTVPFLPPYSGTPAMFGIATGIRDFDDLVRQQAEGKQKPACYFGAGATGKFVQESYPELQMVKTHWKDRKSSFESGRCEVWITDHPIAAQHVLQHYQNGECLINGKPVGVVGDPMPYGLSHYAIGIGHHVDPAVVDTLSYWMNILMTCNPVDVNGHCPDGNLASFFRGRGGTGRECGYVMYPSEGGTKLSGGVIAGIVGGAVALAMILFTFWHCFKLKQQEKRYKKRFVQQIARNIDIGLSPGEIHPEKLAEEVLHICNGNMQGVIKKDDLRRWLNDVRMNFISAKDFDALWAAMDLDGKGEVDPVEFIVFLSACGPEFEEVYREQQKLDKMEKLKLAARRLENLDKVGEDGVRQIERKLDQTCRTGECHLYPRRSSTNVNVIEEEEENENRPMIEKDGSAATSFRTAAVIPEDDEQPPTLNPFDEKNNYRQKQPLSESVATATTMQSSTRTIMQSSMATAATTFLEEEDENAVMQRRDQRPCEGGCGETTTTTTAETCSSRSPEKKDDDDDDEKKEEQQEQEQVRSSENHHRMGHTTANTDETTTPASPGEEAVVVLASSTDAATTMPQQRSSAGGTTTTSGAEDSSGRGRDGATMKDQSLGKSSEGTYSLPNN